MVFKTIKSNKLRLILEHDDISVLPVSYGLSVRDKLLDLDGASTIDDMEFNFILITKSVCL